MNILTSIKNLIPDKNLSAFKTQPNVYNFVVIAGQNYYFHAIKNNDEKTLIIYCKDYHFKKNDKIIDESNILYFVETVDFNFPFRIKYQNEFIQLNLQKISYNNEQPIKLPSYMSNSAVINSNISIEANNSNFGDVGQFLNNQNIDYNTVLKDLENVVYNSYYVEDLSKMLKGIRDSVSQKKPIERNSLSKFFKFMGSELKSLLNVFISAYGYGLSQR